MGNAKSREKQLREDDMAQRRLRQAAERKAKEEEDVRARKEEVDRESAPFSDLLLASSKAYLARKEYDRLRGIAARRKKIAEEILTTESSYISNLKLMIKYFSDPLHAAALAEEDRTTRGSKKKRRQTQAQLVSPPTALHQSKSVIESSSGSPMVPRSEPITRSKSQSVTASLESYYRNGSVSADNSPASSSIKVHPDVVVPVITGLTKEDVRKLFSETRVILSYNENFLLQVEERVSSWSWTQQLGDVFVGMLDWLKAYVQYVNNYNVALETLEKLQSNLQFQEWLKNVESDPVVGGNTITMLLIQPIQRIPRYVMLLEDLVKHTPPGHIDHDNLSTALHRMRDVAIEINQKKRDTEDFALMMDLYNRLEPQYEDLIQPHRKMIKSGPLKTSEKVFQFPRFKLNLQLEFST
eukprot:TRINITY_DN7070_c1_g1_i1.p1 TRINITY_DN7070_c1_g1~~TRINITY_DN7070_c1_g1_i1.p1  ORF type:complete len:412 (-),score=88.04 TRINITY_DN7070_c1_g1_i1:341-1576(-)